MQKRTWSEYAFLASIAVAIAGSCVALGGLAGMQAFCDQNGNLIPGMKTEYITAYKLQYGNTSCAKIFRFEWWGWALQVFFITLTIACWATSNVHNYKSALWAVASTAVVLAMLQANDLIDLYEKTKDDLRLRGVVTFLGYCAFCAGDYLMMFTGNSLYHIKRAEFLEQAKHRMIVSESKKMEGVTIA